MPTCVYYDPSAHNCLVADADQYGFFLSNASTRVRVHDVGELYKQVADAYCYELQDCYQAAPYYKKCLAYLDSRPKNNPAWLGQKVDASESQIRLAMELGDYCQARALCEKLPRLVPDNATARRYLGHIRWAGLPGAQEHEESWVRHSRGCEQLNFYQHRYRQPMSELHRYAWVMSFFAHSSL